LYRIAEGDEGLSGIRRMSEAKTKDGLKPLGK